MHFLAKKDSRPAGWPKAALLIFLLLLFLFVRQTNAQAGDSSQQVDIGILVLSTQNAAEAVLKQLRAGADFSVLAKEKSIDATAVDGGYMGKLDPNQLRMELRDALKGLHAGQISGVARIPSGFAILKVLVTPPALEDLNPNRVASLVTTGVIPNGATVGGYIEALAAMRDYPKPKGWPRDMRQVCEVRTSTAKSANLALRDVLKSTLGTQTTPEQGSMLLQGESALAQLYGFNGEMAESIDAWKEALKLAETVDPGYMPNLLESIGATYLHWSEMENGIYNGSRDLDIFPPLDPHASFEKKDESKQAIVYFRRYLEIRPNDLEVRWLLNLAYATLGEYPSGVPAAFLIPESNFKSKESIGRFVDRAPAAGLNVFGAAGGIIVDDFDNDGLLDVVISSMNVCEPLHFFHNNGDGTFTDRTKEAGLQDQLGGLSMMQVDYNNDGCMDIFIPRGGWEYPQRKSLLRNNCDGTFTDVTDASGLGATVTATQAAAWADIDNDGNLDLFLANENAPAQLFHNKGDGTFEEIGHAAGIDQTAFSKGVSAADYDHDGYMDFYVTNLRGNNFLYHNNGDLTFTEIGRQAGVQAPTFSFASWFFDYDNDGWPDLFVDSYLMVIDETVRTYVGMPHNGETLKLYRNKHDGTFEDVTEQVGLNKVYMPMGANFGDVDNDGFLDVYLGSGNPSFTSTLPYVLMRNKEGKSFVDITQSSGTGELHKGHAVVFADLTRQGNEDILTRVGGAIPPDEHNVRVFENPGNTNDWLNVRLVGVKTNRSGVGAEIHVTVQDGSAAPRSIYRTVGQTSSFGANPMEQHIGLGPSAHDIALDIWWPATRTRQHFTGVEKDQYIEIKEFATSYTKLKRHAPFKLGNNKGATAAAAPKKAN
jgi:tetratricopeptide (TPR) repeat protein